MSATPINLKNEDLFSLLNLVDPDSFAYREQFQHVLTANEPLVLARLAALVGSLPDWSILEAFLPDSLGGPLQKRAALASTLVAGLEMARDGALRMRQDEAFGPIHIRRGDGAG